MTNLNLQEYQARRYPAKTPAPLPNLLPNALRIRDLAQYLGARLNSLQLRIQADFKHERPNPFVKDDAGIYEAKTEDVIAWLDSWVYNSSHLKQLAAIKDRWANPQEEGTIPETPPFKAPPKR